MSFWTLNGLMDNISIMGLPKSSAAVVLLCIVVVCCAQQPEPEPQLAHTYGNFSYHPKEEDLGNVWTGHVKFVRVNFPYCEMNFTRYSVESDEPWTAIVHNYSIEKDPVSDCHGVKVGVKGVHLGAAHIIVRVFYNRADEDNPCETEEECIGNYTVVVMRPPLVEQAIFRFGTAGFLVLLNFGFGCSLNLEIVKEIIRRPFAPAVGFSCQYVMMPLVSVI